MLNSCSKNFFDVSKLPEQDDAFHKPSDDRPLDDHMPGYSPAWTLTTRSTTSDTVCSSRQNQSAGLLQFNPNHYRITQTLVTELMGLLQQTMQPPADMQVSDEKCDEKCRNTEDSCGGYDVEGRQDVYSIYDTGLSRGENMHDDGDSSVSSSIVIPSPPETTSWTSPGLSKAIDQDDKTNPFAPSEIVAHIYQFIGTLNAYWQYLINSIGLFEPKEDKYDRKDLDL
ncbi:hypothetical protein FIE12Z_1349 [Fusarium flagelliforme]|uniref:Uncharacterized protein n=1 Tax=Fusarium flagelliforme TaxID=2675880 RepID=A0A395N341_9HYPO|nr:hypothetical protein FIE12Z_1349 [Fusarium flagelliforme]